MRIALGTVQFGLDYGVANQRGRVPLEEAAAIVRQAGAHGIDTLDTAIAYGDSENTLGQVGVAGWKIVTKLPALAPGCADTAGWVAAQIEGSLRRLGVGRLHGVLLHSPTQLLGKPQGAQLFKALENLKREGLARKIGISVYGPDELDALWPEFPFDLVQAPYNIVDRRLAASGWLARLHRAGAEVHVRSVFLQGLLLMPAQTRRARFGQWQDVWSKWDGWLRSENLNPVRACLAFALARPEIDRVVVGVDSAAQLAEILSLSQGEPIDFPVGIESRNPDLINPSQWKQA